MKTNLVEPITVAFRPSFRERHRKPRPLSSLRLHVTRALLLSLLLPAGIQAGRWTGAGGSLAWSDPNNWFPIGVPGANDVVYVDHEVVLDVDATIGVLYLDPAASGNSMGGLSPFGGRDMTLNAGILNNNGGIFRLNASRLTLIPNGLGEAFINGNGQIFMQDSSANAVRANGGVIYHAEQHLIVGSGNLLGNASGLVNNGTILAAATVLTNGLGELVMSNALVIDPGGTNNTFLNQGVLEARGAAGLQLRGGSYEMGTNVVTVYGGSKLVVGNGAILHGGRYRTLTDPPPPLPGAVARGLAGIAGAGLSEGVIEPLDGAVFESTVIDGRVVQDNYRWPIIRGGLENNGVWFINGAGNSTLLRFDGNQALTGSGRIELSDSPNNQILSKNGGEVLTNGPDHTIQGAGNLLKNGGSLINQGTIKATGADHPLVIDPDAQGFTNQGNLQAVGPAGLQFNAGLFANTGHTIEVLDGSQLVVWGDALVQGGTLQTAGSGAVRPQDNSVFEEVTLEGQVIQDNYRWPIIRGGLENNGVWFINGAGNSTLLRFDGNQALTGNGRIELSDSPNNQILSKNGGEVLTNGPDHTLQGAGNLLNNGGGLINQGTVKATGTDHPLVIDPGVQGFTNQGNLQAVGPAGLQFNAGLFANTGHTIEVFDNSQLVVQGDAVVQGGTAQTTGSGAVRPQDNSVFEGVDLQGQVIQDNYQWPIIRGGLENNGVWFINGAGNTTHLRFDGNQALTGNGRIELSDSPHNQIIAMTGGDILTNGPDHTLQGAGNLLKNGGGLINQGTIKATGTDHPLVIDPGPAGFVNAGNLQAVGPAGLQFNAGLFANTGHTIEVLDGSQLVVWGDAVVQGGTVQTTGSGAVRPQDNSVFEGVTLQGQVIQDNYQWPIIRGGLENNGVWFINGAGNTTHLRFDGNQALTGNGRIELSDSPHNQIVPGQSGQILTNGPNHTIQGAGNLLVNNGSLVNEGVLWGNAVQNPLTIDPNPSGFLNHGQLRATGDAGVTLNAGAFETDGRVEVAAGSQLNRSGDYVQTGGETRVEGTLSATGRILLQGGLLGGSGTVSAVSNEGGQVAPGASAGRLSVDGEFTQSGTGALVIEIGGLTAGTEHDQLAVTGDVNLGGNLQVSLLGGYVPNVGDQFTVLTATGQVDGTFAQGGTVQTGGQVFRVGYTDHEVILTYTGGGGETFDSWQLTHFPNDLDKPEISGFDADPDGDGVANGFEFAGGSDPNDPNDAPDVAAGIEGERFVAEFVRETNALGVEITAEASVTAAPWAADPALLQSPPEVVDNGDGTETLRFLSANAVPGLPTLFVRFVVTETP